MSKYNVGDKFVLEITRDVTRTDDKTEYYVTNDGRIWATNELDELQKYDKPTISEDTLEMERMKALNEGRNEVRELANKLNNMAMQDIINIYGFCLGRDKVFEAITPQEALVKFEEYEKEQAEIKVGDEIIVDGTTLKGYVIDKHIEYEDCYVVLITNYKNLYSAIYNKNVIKKTGKHIDIQSILQQIKTK